MKAFFSLILLTAVAFAQASAPATSDQAIPVDQVEQFDARLTETGLDHEIHVYPGAPHSFFDRRFEDYAEACEDAWRRMLGFLERHTG